MKLEPIRESLWRDIVGFIPLYSIVLGFGTWLSAQEFGWPWLNRLWFLFPAAAAVADWAEDICHLKYLRLHEQGHKPLLPLTAFSFMMTLMKFLAFAAEALLSLAVIASMSWRLLLDSAQAGWRGLLALSVTILTLLAVVTIAVWAVIYRAQSKPKPDRPTFPTEEARSPAGD
jgi:hypothetical protein